jgi:hypothetical protein
MQNDLEARSLLPQPFAEQLLVYDLHAHQGKSDFPQIAFWALMFKVSLCEFRKQNDELENAPYLTVSSVCARDFM